jgi:3-isopropylmalate/(R)-2-methylmalate dehydratase large subunit
MARTSIAISNSTPRLPPIRHLGHQPRDVATIEAWCPTRRKSQTRASNAKITRALEYMGLTPGTRITDIPLDVIFIGSCTNSRTRTARGSRVVEGRRYRTGWPTP